MHDKTLLGSSIVIKSTKSSSDQKVLEALLRQIRKSGSFVSEQPSAPKQAVYLLATATGLG